MKKRGTAVVLGVAVALLAPWRASVAEQLPEGKLSSVQNQPWTQGISAQDQEAARALFLQANGQLRDSDYKGAVENYSKAIEFWKNPAIYYNRALARMNLDQPLELYQDLVEATRYGQAGLDPQRFEFAQKTLALVEKQLARVKISCAEPGARVMLNGRQLFEAPGTLEELVRPGIYSVEVIKEGYLPYSKSHTLLPGNRLILGIKLTEDRIDYQTRWPTWRPWVVLGAGAALAAGGGVLHLQVSNYYRDFDAGIKACDGGEGVGCVPTPELAGLRSRGDTLQRVAVSAYTVGGAALATGVWLLYLNRPQAIRPTPVPSEEQIVVLPLLGGGVGGAQATIRF